MADSDYIPDSDPEFNIFQDNLVSTCETNATKWGIDAEALTVIKGYQAPWKAAFAIASNQQSRSSSDVHAKNEARSPYEKELRRFVGEYLAVNRKITNFERQNMGLTIRSNSRTPVASPTTYPIGKVDRSLNLIHTIQISNSEGIGKAKPKGAFGCEIWIKIGTEMPKDSSDFTFHGVSTKNSYTVEFSDADKGKIAYYRLRWMNKRGEPGPWADVIFAMITG